LLNIISSISEVLLH